MSAYAILKDLVKATIGFRDRRKHDIAEQPKKKFLERYLRVFEVQGIKRAQIGRVLPVDFALKPSNLLDDERLFGLLDDRLLDHVAQKFGVQRSWLDGASDAIYPRIRWIYKDLGEFIQLLQILRSKHSQLEFYVFKGSKNEISKETSHENIAIAIRGGVDELDDELIWRDYFFSENWPWAHTPARIELKAACLIAWQFNLVPICLNVDQSYIDRYIAGEVFLAELIACARAPSWHLDDYIFTSEESGCALDEEEAKEVGMYIKASGLLQPLLSAAGIKEIKKVKNRI